MRVSLDSGTASGACGHCFRPPLAVPQPDPLPFCSGDITASREYWRVNVPANSQTD